MKSIIFDKEIEYIRNIGFFIILSIKILNITNERG